MLTTEPESQPRATAPPRRRLQPPDAIPLQPFTTGHSSSSEGSQIVQCVAAAMPQDEFLAWIKKLCIRSESADRVAVRQPPVDSAGPRSALPQLVAGDGHPRWSQAACHSPSSTNPAAAAEYARDNLALAGASANRNRQQLERNRLCSPCRGRSSRVVHSRIRRSEATVSAQVLDRLISESPEPPMPAAQSAARPPEPQLPERLPRQPRTESARRPPRGTGRFPGTLELERKT